MSQTLLEIKTLLLCSVVLKVIRRNTTILKLGAMRAETIPLYFITSTSLKAITNDTAAGIFLLFSTVLHTSPNNPSESKKLSSANLLCQFPQLKQMKIILTFCAVVWMLSIVAVVTSSEASCWTQIQFSEAPEGSVSFKEPCQSFTLAKWIQRKESNCVMGWFFVFPSSKRPAKCNILLKACLKWSAQNSKIQEP